MIINFNKSKSLEITGATNKAEIVSYNLIGTPAGTPKVAHGDIKQNANGTYEYIPTLGFFGIETLSFSNGQSMSLLVGPPTGKGLKDVAEGVQSIGSIISNVRVDDKNDPNSNLTNKNLEAVDRQEFSHFTLENNAKWEQLGQQTDIDGDGNEWEFKYFDSKLQELQDIATQTKELGSTVNLHTVLWNQPGNQPAHIATRYEQDIVIGNNGVVTDEFRVWFEAQIGTHVDTLLNTLGNTINIVDVVNEHIFSNVKGNVGLYHKFYDKPTDYIKAAFTQTSAAIERYNSTHAPEEQIDARLAVNDFNVLYRFDENKYDPTLKGEEVKADIYYNMVKDLIDDGVKIDAVGFQSHLVVDRINAYIGKNTDNDDLNDNVIPTGQEIYDAILSNLQRFIDLGVDILISELDVRTHLNVVVENGDANKKISDFNKIYEVIGALAHDIPEITDVVLWGTTHRASWLKDFENDPLLFTNNYGREDEYYAFMEGLTGNSEFNRVETGETNRIPLAENDEGHAVLAGGSATIDVLANDQDRDGDPLTVTQVNGAAFSDTGWTNYISGVGVIKHNGGGKLTHYTLDTTAEKYSYEYTVSDNQRGTDTATVTGSIYRGQTTTPIAKSDDGFSVTSGGTAKLNVLANDRDGDALLVTHINSIQLDENGWSNYVSGLGMIQRNPDGSLTHYALDAPVGNYTFEYTVSDEHGGTANATVTGSIAPTTPVVPVTPPTVETTTNEIAPIPSTDNETAVVESITQPVVQPKPTETKPVEVPAPAEPPVETSLPEPVVITENMNQIAAPVPSSQPVVQSKPTEVKQAEIRIPTQVSIEDILLSSVVTSDNVTQFAATGPVSKNVAPSKPLEFASFDSAAASLNVTNFAPEQQELFDVENQYFDQAELGLSDEFFI